MENNSFEKDGKSIFGESAHEQGEMSIESQKITLAEQILKHYWESPKPFRKLSEYKDNGMPLPTGEKAWRMLQGFVKFQFESHLPWPERAATETGIDQKVIEALYKLAKEEK